MIKQSIIDTDILSEFLRGNPNVIAKVDEHLKEYGFKSHIVGKYVMS